MADVVLQAGRKITMSGLFIQPRTVMSSPIAEQLRCALEDGAIGLFIQVCEGKVTSVHNVFVCGDAARIQKRMRELFARCSVRLHAQ